MGKQQRKLHSIILLYNSKSYFVLPFLKILYFVFFHISQFVAAYTAEYIFNTLQDVCIHVVAELR